MRRDKPRPQTLRSLLAEKFYTASVSDLLNLKDINKNKDIGSSRQSSHERPMCGGLSAKPTEVKNLFTISKTKANSLRPLAEIPE